MTRPCVNSGSLFEPPTCFIGRLIVHPEYQGQGIGTELMKAIETHSREASRYELFTGHRSIRNLHLYRRLGYTVFYTQKVSEKLSLVYLDKSNQPRRPKASGSPSSETSPIL